MEIQTMDTNKHYYFGYGLNTNKDSMATRCPDAVSLGSAALFDWRFRFAYHADVVPSEGHRVSGVLWEITDECLSSLDRLEGFPHYYERKLVPVIHHNQVYNSICYYMTPGNTDCPPPEYYWRMLMEGYHEHNVTRKQLWAALRASYNDNDSCVDDLIVAKDFIVSVH